MTALPLPPLRTVLMRSVGHGSVGPDSLNRGLRWDFAGLVFCFCQDDTYNKNWRRIFVACFSFGFYDQIPNRAVADCGRTVINFGAWLKYRAVRTVTDWKNCYKLCDQIPNR